MNDSLTVLVKVKALVETDITLRLLRASNLSLIITFLYREFKAAEQLSVPFQLLSHHLADFLDSSQYMDTQEEVALEKGSPDLDERARRYLNRWIDLHYLRNVVDDATKEPFVLLSKHTEKAFQVFDLLKEKEFVGTESKLKDLFLKLQDITENAHPEKEKKLAELLRRKTQIEEQIRSLKKDGYVKVYENYQITSRVGDISRMVNELIGDFNEVEDNFKEITRKIYLDQQQTLTKGKMVSQTFDSLHALKNTNQGRSFYAFWQFLLDDSSQAELQQLVRELYQILDERGMEAPTRPLRRLKILLHQAARKVLEKNSILADKLSREIVAKDQPHSRQARQLMASIRHLALQHMDLPMHREFYLELAGLPCIDLPMDRKLGHPGHNSVLCTTAAQARHTLEDLEDLAMIYSAHLIDKNELLENIRLLLLDRSQVSLLEVIQAWGITRGLAEVLAYVGLSNESTKFFINEAIRELVPFDFLLGKYLDLPQIIFAK